MSRVFLDANVLIYLFEGHPEHGPQVRALLRRMDERGDQLCTSALVAAEVETGAQMMGDDALRRTYRELFASPGWELLPFGASTIEHFVAARTLPGVKAPDAVHLACAAEHQVDVFLTHDARLTRVNMPGVQFIVGLQTDIFGPLDVEC